ncbi:MAG: NADH-quinone oxidoreductase subunit K [Actinomycetota bacterium]
MNASLLLVVGGLTTIGLYLITARSLSRIVLGFSLLGHAAVVALLAAGSSGEAPIANRADISEVANPVPQALALTAIVISFGLTLFLLALARRQATLTGDDEVQDDIEDRRVADDVEEATVAEEPAHETDKTDETDETDEASDASSSEESAS